MKHDLRASYKEARAPRYPSVGDQLDALWRLVAALEDQGLALPPETAGLLTEIAGVKARSPKIPDPAKEG